jgi:retron-type reverse transcriptase
MRGRSVETNLVSLTQFLAEALNENKQVDVIYTDFSKAFDRIDHQLLLHKLDRFGFSDQLIKLMCSYLCDRHLFVRVNGFKSGLFRQSTGVPQGSVLGPFLL